MAKTNGKIPINSMADDFSQGISVERMIIRKSDFEAGQQYESANDSHRDDGHTFHIVEAGTILIEIDFEQYEVTGPSVVYMHPTQVHRILDFDEVTVASVSIRNEAMNPDYIDFLEELVPSKPLALINDADSKVSTIFALCLGFSEEHSGRFYFPLLNDSCNTLVSYLISQFLQQDPQTANLPRYALITKSFRLLLEKNYRQLKRAGDYADHLNISVPYLNECISVSTGHSVSKNIHNRIILEAKRMLYYTDKSVKEISYDLGYDDYIYFTKLFKKIAGMSGLAFRNKNRD
ncbi:MAG: AraC family transcriptional regulator [Pedobacter sp.]